MRQVVARDEDAFTLLVDRYLDGLYSFVLRFCGTREDAEDVAQATFIRVWDRASTWRPGKVKFKTWLFQIARNLCLDEYRKRKDNTESTWDPDDIAIEDRLSIEKEERVDALYKALAKLPERQRTAVILCNIKGWSQAEAAEILGCTVNAIDALLGRGRRALRVSLEQYK